MSIDFVFGTCDILNHVADHIDLYGSFALRNEAGICSTSSVTSDE